MDTESEQLDPHSSGRCNGDILCDLGVAVPQHGAVLDSAAVFQPFLGSVKPPELCGVTRRFYIPDSCFPEFHLVQHHDFFW